MTEYMVEYMMGTVPAFISVVAVAVALGVGAGAVHHLNLGGGP